MSAGLQRPHHRPVERPTHNLQMLGLLTSNCDSHSVLEHWFACDYSIYCSLVFPYVVKGCTLEWPWNSDVDVQISKEFGRQKRKL